jgi:hypothetical protein
VALEAGDRAVAESAGRASILGGGLADLPLRPRHLAHVGHGWEVLKAWGRGRRKERSALCEELKNGPRLALEDMPWAKGEADTVS